MPVLPRGGDRAAQLPTGISLVLVHGHRVDHPKLVGDLGAMRSAMASI
jgi:hypothetical protein